jgi:hypothetical protein
MNWDELRQVDAEGVLDVQSHALTHTWRFSEPTVEDIHRPRAIDPYPWLAWNQRPNRKAYYLNENQQDFVPWGHPVFKHEKSLVVREFYPDKELIDEIAEFVSDNGGAEFFDNREWRKKLTSRFRYLDGNSKFPGTFETLADYEKRVRHELVESKAKLERELGKTVRFLSWPGGGVNETAAILATEIGYISSTLSSWQRPESRNIPGSDPSGIKRISGRSKVHWNGIWIANGGAWWVVQRVLTHQGSLISSILAKLRKGFWIVGVNLLGSASSPASEE